MFPRSISCWMLPAIRAGNLSSAFSCLWFRRHGGRSSRLLTNYVIALQPDTYERSQTLSKVFAGCSERPSSKAATSEDRRRYRPHFVGPFARTMGLGERKNPSSARPSELFLLHVEGLNDARTPLAGCAGKNGVSRSGKAIFGKEG